MRLTSLARGGNVSLGIAEDTVEMSFVKHINIKNTRPIASQKESMAQVEGAIWWV
jgi:hypothetical protein